MSHERFSKEIRKQLRQLNEIEKDFLLSAVFVLLWQTYSQDDWESTNSEEDLKHINNIFERVF